MTPEQLAQVLAELAAHESDCAPQPYDDDQGYLDWAVDQEKLAASAAAYAHAQRIIREAAGVAA